MKVAAPAATFPFDPAGPGLSILVVVNTPAMLTISYASITAAVVAAAAIGATGAAWVLCGALVENRALVNRLRRFESRAGQVSRRGSRATPPAAWPWDIRSSAAGTVLRHNRAQVRRALRASERLLRASRRRHVGTHRLDGWTGPTPPRRPVLAQQTTIMTHRPAAPRRLAIEAA